MLKRIAPFYRSEADVATLNGILRVMLGQGRADRAFRTMYLLTSDALKRLPNPSLRRQVLPREHRGIPGPAHYCHRS